LAEDRAVPAALPALRRIVERFFDGNEQKTIGAWELARLAIPIKVLWGTQDRVLPTRQAHKLPGRIAVHIFEKTGHMLPQEIPGEVAHLILENTR
jgi:pyruvate dehydrogenase E2 component (dihydrolipoamide acetyltransferase)